MELNLKRQLTPFEWLQMPKEARDLFIKWFNIPRSGGSIVVNNEVVSDGHTIADLSAVSLQSLQAFLHTDETHWDKLLQLTINQMENYIDGNPESTVTGSKGTGKTGRTKKTKAAV